MYFSFRFITFQKLSDKFHAYRIINFSVSKITVAYFHTGVRIIINDNYYLRHVK